MTTSLLPSAVYLLLKNSNSWSNSDEADKIIAGLADGHWQFDPNESHEEGTLLRTLLQNWTSRSPDASERLLLIVELLLDRGAIADCVMKLSAEPYEEHFKWDGLGQVKKLLMTRIGQYQPHADDSLAREITQQLCYLSVEKIDALLQDGIGWNGKLHGMHVLPWMLLQFRDYGKDLPDPIGSSSGSSGSINLQRFAKNLVNEGRKHASLEDNDLAALAIALCGLASDKHGNSTQYNMADSCDAMAGRIIRGKDLVNLFGQLARQDFSPEIQARLGGAMLCGTPGLVKDNEKAWECLAAGLPLISHPLIKMAHLSVGSDTLAQHQAPPAWWWEQLPVDERHRDMMLDLVLVSLIKSGDQLEKSRAQILSDLGQWLRDNPQLPALDMERAQRIGGNPLKNDKRMTGALEGFVIEHATPQAKAQAGKAKMRL